MSVRGQRPPLTAKTTHSPTINSVSPKAQRNFLDQPSQGRARIDAAMTAQIAVCSSLICRSVCASVSVESCVCSMTRHLFLACERSSPCSRGSARQPPPALRERQPRHTNHFIAAGLAGCNSNGGTRNVQKFCEKIDAGFVGLAIDWRSGQSQFQPVAYFACDGILLGARMDFDRESDSPRRILDGYHRKLNHRVHRGHRGIEDRLLGSPVCLCVPCG